MIFSLLTNIPRKSMFCAVYCLQVQLQSCFLLKPQKNMLITTEHVPPLLSCHFIDNRNQTLRRMKKRTPDSVHNSNRNCFVHCQDQGVFLRLVVRFRSIQIQVTEFVKKIAQLEIHLFTRFGRSSSQYTVKVDITVR